MHRVLLIQALPTMHRPLEDFIRALRATDVRVSVAEALDAHEVVARIGFDDRQLLKDSLGLTVAKTVGEKQRFVDAFELFFARDEFTTTLEPELDFETGNPLADMLLNRDSDGLAAAMEAAARDTGVGTIRFATQIGFMARRMLDRMGLRELEQLIIAAGQDGQGGGSDGGAMAESLGAARRQLLGEARQFVERQFELYGRIEGQRLREDVLQRTALAAVDRRDFARMNSLIRRMAKKLASRYMHRHKRTRRGHLDVRRTLRANMAHDGILFETFWKQKKIERPKIVVICDVSRSVAAAAQFLLMFLYNLNEVVSEIRSFAFSSYLIEIDDILDDHSVEGAIPAVLDKIGYMSTDYGRALDDLKTQHGAAIDRRTTVIFLGDARSNYGNPRADIMKWLNQRAKRVVWLNPEPQTFWGTGDSEMPRYRPYCHVAKTCRTIKHLERVVDDILRSSNRA
jgi:uncharacterized protein